MEIIKRLVTARALIVGLATSALVLAATFGINVSDAQSAAIVGFIEKALLVLGAMVLVEMKSTEDKVASSQRTHITIPPKVDQ